MREDCRALSLSANCFGDHYTRTGIDVRTRELLTFAMLVSLGGCEPQVKGHVAGNRNAGNDDQRSHPGVSTRAWLITGPGMNRQTCVSIQPMMSAVTSARFSSFSRSDWI